MNIQNSNVNFGAKRIFNMRKVVPGNPDVIYDIFALGREDKKFMEKCNATLQGTDRSIVSSSGNTNLLDRDLDSGYKNFFRDFLIRLLAKKPKHVQKFDDVHCFVTIKDGETIAGIAEISDANFPIANLDRMIFPKKDKSLKDGFLYGILGNLKNVFSKEGQTGLANLNPQLSIKVNKEGFLNLDDFEHVQEVIMRKNRNIDFNNVQDPHHYDLEDFLGIKDFETEIMG